MNFKALGIIDPLLKALSEKGYETPTDIQEKAIPLVLKGKDILGSAQTGTGKTAAFALPIIQYLHEHKTKRRYVKALIVTPTRELALQIDENVKKYSKYTDVRHTVIFGGVGQDKQIRALKSGVELITATPGRLLDLMNQGYIDLSDIEVFVLDEADRMLDMGFIHDVKRILKVLPKKRQSLFFSATLPPNIIKLSEEILYKPSHVKVAPVSSSAETVQQYVYYTNRADKRELLKHILQDESIDQVLLFDRTKHGTNKVARQLSKSGISAAAIHGDKSQNQRQRALSDFKEGKLRVLVATDIVARGIDIDKLKYVINYNIPNESESYVHRIGRSGRAGEEGIAISISEPEENAFVKDIEKLINQKITVVEEHPFPQTEKPMTAAEKKEWNKEKNKRRQEFFANRNKKRAERGSDNNNKGGKSRNNRRKGKRK